jgi:hypothetical protein
MNPRRQVPVRELIYLSACLLFAATLAVLEASRFETKELGRRAMDSFSYFSIAFACSIGYGLSSPCRSDEPGAPSVWNRSLTAGFLMLLAADLAASLVRRELIVIILPALFSLPGAALGASLLSFRQTTGETAEEEMAAS